MGKRRRLGLVGLLLSGTVLSGCQYHIMEDFDLLRSNGNPQTTMDYAARIQARKAKQQARDREANPAETDDDNRATGRDE